MTDIHDWPREEDAIGRSARPRVNRYGRRGGRGARPWLLLPKIIAVSVWLGGLAVLTYVTWRLPMGDAGGAASPDAGRALAWMGEVFWYLLTPALIVAFVLGSLLNLQASAVFRRMRWWQVKMALVVVLLAQWGVIALLLWSLQDDDGQSGGAATLMGLRWMLVGALVVSVLVSLIGRHKPRLGQNPARALAGLGEAR